MNVLEITYLLRLTNLVAALFGVAAMAYAAYKCRPLFAYLFPFAFWLFHVAVYFTVAILRIHDLVGMSSYAVHIWSNLLRFQILFTIIYMSYRLARRCRAL